MILCVIAGLTRNRLTFKPLVFWRLRVKPAMTVKTSLQN